MFSQPAPAHRAGASSSSLEGCSPLAEGERAAEGRPQLPPALPGCLRGVKLCPAGARGVQLSQAGGAEGTSLETEQPQSSCLRKRAADLTPVG